MERVTKSNGLAEIAEALEVEIGDNVHEIARKSVAFPQPESGDGEGSAADLNILVRRVSEGSTRKVDNLIGELQELRKKLMTDRDRIQSDITRHAEMSQDVIQLTTIISDSVKKIPGAPSISL